MAANYQQIYTMNAGVQQLSTIIRSNAFANHLRTELKSENPTPTGVWFRLHHGVTFTSWGEKITVTLTPLRENVTQVTIHSECGMPTQVIDWGKNKQVVCNIYEYLAAHIGRGASVESHAQPTPVQSAGGYCSNCGKPVRVDANFCASCGTKLK